MTAGDTASVEWPRIDQTPRRSWPTSEKTRCDSVEYLPAAGSGKGGGGGGRRKRGRERDWEKCGEGLEGIMLYLGSVRALGY